MFKNLEIKSGYATNINDIGFEFYTPILKNSVYFKRVAGYFSSKSFLFYSNGLHGLLNNNGKFDLIISSQISEEDYYLIKKGYELRDKYKNRILSIFDDFSKFDDTSKMKISNLAYLIERKLVDIKIGFTHNGIFHAKYGIFSDKFGNKIYFTGSLNETSNAFKYNYEEITVLRNWTNDNDKNHIEIMEKKFDDLWNKSNHDDMVFVEDANELFKNEFVKYSKGEIILDSSLMSMNSLILYYDNKLKIKNNLNRKDINLNNSIIKRIQNKYLEDIKNWVFKSDLTKNQIKDVIRELERYEKKFLKKDLGEKFIVSNSINEYLKFLEFKINDIYNRGILIKSMDESLNNSFEEFNDVIMNEISRPLRHIQSWVSFYMTKMQRVSNFSVPGSGKTAMIYGSFAYLSAKKEVKKVVVICPKSAFISWIDEFSVVFGKKKSLNVLNIHEKNFDQSMFYKNISQYNLILINYESIIKYEKELLQIIDDKTMIVFDEVHKVKKIDSDRANTCIYIAQNAKYRYCLTGTPIPNKYTDIWNILQILYKEEYKNFFGINKTELENPTYANILDINQKINPFFWRVTKFDLDVPKANPDIILEYKATNEEQKVINLLWRKYRREPFKLYIRLIQLSSNPELLKRNLNIEIFSTYDLIDNGDKLEFDTEDIEDIVSYDENERKIINSLTKSTKYRACIHKVDGLVREGKTVLVWCIFIDTINKVKNDLSSLGHSVAVINGSTSLEDRNRIIKQYQEGFYDVLVTNPHTLAESVSLHHICHNAIYLEYSFNLTHMLQSRDRIHRLGLENDDETNYYYFMLNGQPYERNTIDWKIYNRLKEKEEIMLSAIESGELKPQFDYNEKQEIIDLINEEYEY